MTATDPCRLRNAARQFRAGVLRGAIDRTLLAHGIDLPALAEVLHGIAELRAERTANLNCLCRRSDDGKILDSSQCSVHRPGAAPVAAVVPASGHMPEDDWESLRAAVGFVGEPPRRMCPEHPSSTWQDESDNRHCTVCTWVSPASIIARVDCDRPRVVTAQPSDQEGRAV
jgi:hypothetical protein